MSSSSITDKEKENPARKVFVNNPGMIHHSYSFPRILLANVRSLLNKREELHIIFDKNQIDIACLTETWSATKDSCSIPNYDSHFKPRLDKDGIPLSHDGGVTFFVSVPSQIGFFHFLKQRLTPKLKFYGSGPDPKTSQKTYLA